MHPSGDSLTTNTPAMVAATSSPEANKTNKLSGASSLLASLTPKTLTKFSMERQSTLASTATQAHARTITIEPIPLSPNTDRKESHTSGRSNSTTSGASFNSDTESTGSGGKRSSWTKNFFSGMRSKSQSSLNALDKHDSLLLGQAPMPNCLQAHEARLRRIYESTKKNVDGLIVRTQHTEADIMQMVTRHCHHIGCRRKLINAAMRNLERRISMLNKYRDAIFHFVVNRHQEVLQGMPSKKAEADALFDLCVLNSKECMNLANQGAHTSGTMLVSIADRLHKLQKQLNETTQEELDAQITPSRSMSALSIHSHGDGESEDYVMAVVPTVPQPITFKLVRPAKSKLHGANSGPLSSGSGSNSTGPASPCARSSRIGSKLTNNGTSGVV